MLAGDRELAVAIVAQATAEQPWIDLEIVPTKPAFDRDPPIDLPH